MGEERRNMQNIARFLLTASLILALSGCITTVSDPIPPEPPPQEEVIGVAPYTGAVWAKGSWEWQSRHHRYHWHRGYWRR
jgi:hypothetical protein